MLKEEKISRILVVDSDERFLKRISFIIKGITDNLNVNTDLISKLKLDDKLTEEQQNFELAFIDYQLFLSENQTILSQFFADNPNCLVILLISNMGGNDLQQIIATFKKYNQQFLGDHILKDNYSDDVMSVFCKIFIKKAVKK